MHFKFFNFMFLLNSRATIFWCTHTYVWWSWLNGLKSLSHLSHNPLHLIFFRLSLRMTVASVCCLPCFGCSFYIKIAADWTLAIKSDAADRTRREKDTFYVNPSRKLKAKMKLQWEEWRKVATVSTKMYRHICKRAVQIRF